MTRRTWIVVVNYGSHDLIERNFAPDFGGPSSSFSLVVVDNYFSETERDDIRAVCKRQGWMCLGRDGNDGFAAGCNLGVSTAREGGARSVVLVNPDAEVAVSVVRALAAQLEDEPMTLISPTIKTSAGRPYFQGSRIDLSRGRMHGRRWSYEAGGAEYLSSEPPYRDWLSGACLAFTVQLWERAGGLDERYFLYWEDVDFSQRCLAAGARLCLRRDLVVVHDEGATHGAQGSRARSPIYYYYNCRNRLLYGATQLPRGKLLRWVLTTPGESWQILLRGGRRQLLNSPKPLWAAISGSFAGLAHVAATMLGWRSRRPGRARP